LIILLDRDSSDYNLIYEAANTIARKNCSIHIFQTGRTNLEHGACVPAGKSSDVFSDVMSTTCTTPAASPDVTIELQNQFSRLEAVGKIPGIESGSELTMQHFCMLEPSLQLENSLHALQQISSDVTSEIVSKPDLEFHLHLLDI